MNIPEIFFKVTVHVDVPLSYFTNTETTSISVFGLKAKLPFQSTRWVTLPNNRH